jgi:WD40 repeat protein
VGYNADPHYKRVHAITFLPDSKSLLSSSSFPGLLHWNLETGERRHVGSLGGANIRLFPDAKKVLADSSNIYIISLIDGSFKEFEGSSAAIINSGDSIRMVNYVGTLGRDYKFQITDFDVQNGEVIQRYEPFDAGTPHIRVSPDGSIITGLSETTPRLLTFRDGRSGAVLNQLQRESAKPITAFTFSPDSRKAIVVLENKVEIFDISSLTSHVPGAVELINYEN